MKTKLKFTFLILITTVAINSCKKELRTEQSQGGMLNVTNAVIGATTFNLMSTFSVSSYLNQIPNNQSYIMPVASGQQTLNFGLPAKAATATTPAVPATIYYSQNITMDNTSNYSLFLTGTSTSAIESVLVKESYPYAYQDSTCGVRFINLSPGSSPISVNLKGSSNGSEASNLAYKAYNDFKKYVCKKATPNYVFEFRDAATGTLLTSFTMAMPYFHNTTLCLRGKAGAYGVIQNNDF